MQNITLQYVKMSYDVSNENTVIIPDIIPTKFQEYLQDNIKKLFDNQNNRHYKERSLDTEVLRVCIDLITRYVSKEQREDLPLLLKESSTKVAHRLFRVERDVQDSIKHLGTIILKGSLIVSLIKGQSIDDTTTNEYFVVIAKIKHTGYYDETHYKQQSGIPIDDGKIWKSALLRFYLDDSNSVLFDEGLLYCAQEAKYWADSFLELDEMRTDEVNTKTAFEQTSRVISQKLNKYPSDYIIIYNSFLGKFKTSETTVNYRRIVDDVLLGYEPNSSGLSKDKIEALITELKELPNKYNFDIEFNIVPHAVKNRTKRYDIVKGITLNICDYVKDISSVVESYEDEDTGNKYIRIRTDEENIRTYNSFLRKE